MTAYEILQYASTARLWISFTVQYLQAQYCTHTRHAWLIAPVSVFRYHYDWQGWAVSCKFNRGVNCKAKKITWTRPVHISAFPNYNSALACSRPPGGGHSTFFSGRGVRPGVGLANWHLPLKRGACERKISKFWGLWAENFQIWGLVS